MQFIDITMELSASTPVYQTDPRISLTPHATVEQDGYAVTAMSMGSHSGTHLDAPRHLDPEGRSVVDIPLDILVGKCFVVDINDFRVPSNVKRLLIRGRSASEDTLNLRQAQALLDAGVELIGTDGISVGDPDVHALLLGSDCVVLECLDLSRAEAGTYYVLCALPLKVDCDGSPIRACLMANSR